MIEADDHASGDEQVVRLNLVHRRDQVDPLVLELAGFGEARLAGRLDADEHRAEVRVAQQCQQLLVAHHVDADLGVERQGVTLAAVPGDQRPQQVLGVGAVADEVVVGEEDLRRAARDATPLLRG